MSVFPDYLFIKKEELSDPVINVATGVRWLRVKYFIYKKRKGDPIYNMVKGYYSLNKDGDDYAKKVFSLYNKSK